jgi:hypothetical protein
MSEQTPRTDEEDREEMDRVARNIGFKSAKDMAGALLDHELETTEDIERLRFWAQNIRKLSAYKTDKLEREIAASEAKRQADLRLALEIGHQHAAGDGYGEAMRAAFPGVFP